MKSSLYILDNSPFSEVIFANISSQSVTCLCVALIVYFAEQKFLIFFFFKYIQWNIYLAIKNEIMPFAPTWKKTEIIILSKISQREKDKYHMTTLICGIWSMTQMNLLTRPKRHTDTENKLMAKGGANSQSLELIGISRCKLVYIGWINDVLLYTTWNYIQYPVYKP